MNKKQFNITATIIIFLMLLFIMPSISNAQEEEQASEKDTKCTVEMKPFLEEKGLEFRQYLEAHFSNKSPNSSLLDLALERFTKYKKDVTDEFKTYFPEAGRPQVTETLDTLNCYNQLNQETELMKELLKKYYNQTATIKSAARLKEKLAAINAKLDTLNGRIINMRGKWSAFGDRFPCFIQDCL